MGLLRGQAGGTRRCREPLRYRRPAIRMSDAVRETARDDVPAGAPVLRQLATLGRLLPVWIVAAMALGLALGRWVPGLDDALSARRGRGRGHPPRPRAPARRR